MFFFANLERLPFVWKSRKFRGEFKWNGSFLWKFSGQKVIPFAVFPFFPVVTQTTEIFCTICLDYQYQASSREKGKKLFVFCEWYNSIPFLIFENQKKKNTSTIWRKFFTKISAQMVSAPRLTDFFGCFRCLRRLALHYFIFCSVNYRY